MGEKLGGPLKEVVALLFVQIGQDIKENIN